MFKKKCFCRGPGESVALNKIISDCIRTAKLIEEIITDYSCRNYIIGKRVDYSAVLFCMGSRLETVAHKHVVSQKQLFYGSKKPI